MNPLVQQIMAWLGGGGGGAAGGAGAPNIQALLPFILQILSASGAAGYGNEQLNILKQLFAQQQHAANLAMNPAALSRRAVEATVPLTKAQTYFGTQAADAAVANAGMGQSPGAVASAVTGQLVPLQEANLQMGEQNATAGLPYAFATQPPDYLGILNELNTLGRNTGGAYSLPTP